MANELALELIHAFDKAAYNRQYYQRNKDKWQDYSGGKSRRDSYKDKQREVVESVYSTIKKNNKETADKYTKAVAGTKKVQRKMNEAYEKASYERGKGTLNYVPSSQKAINNIKAKITKYGTPAPSSSKNKYYQEAMAKASYARGKATMPTSVNEKKKKKSSPAAKAKKFLKKLFKW